jgi:hypothetical protein
VHESGKIRRDDLEPAPDAAPDRIPADLDAREAQPDLGRTDEEDASDARRRFRSHGIEPLAPDACIGSMLAPGEDVLAHHRSVGLDRLQRSKEIEPTVPMLGDLYVTSARLVHLGLRVLTIELDDIEDAALVGDRVLLVIRGGTGVALETDRPRLLRVQMAAARAARSGPTGRRPGRSQPAAR